MRGEAFGETDEPVIAAGQVDVLVAGPRPVSQKIDFDSDVDTVGGDQVETFALEPGEQERIRGHARRHLRVAPRPAPSLRASPTPEVVGLAEPDAALRLADHGIVVAVGRGLVAAQRQHAAEGAVIGNDA